MREAEFIPDPRIRALPVTNADIDQADVILIKNNNHGGAAQKNDATAASRSHRCR